MMFTTQLNSEERIIVVVRKHWLIFAFEAFAVLVAALLPLIVAILAPNGTADALLTIGVSPTFLIFLYTLYLLMMWTVGFIVWTLYFLDMWVVTNHRVINIDQRTLFFRDVTTVMVEKIQDVTVEVKGVLADVFGFGTLTLHTAGETPDLRIRFAIAPSDARDKILEMQEAEHGGRIA